MNHPPYPFDSISKTEEVVIYAFVSRSPQMTIQKVVLFTLVDEDAYNMALGDLLASGVLSDTVISNNQDMEKVLATVIQIMIDFFRNKPMTTILFTGSTPARTRLYRVVISTYLAEIEKVFRVSGSMPDGETERFRANRPYTGFVVSLL